MVKFSVFRWLQLSGILFFIVSFVAGCNFFGPEINDEVVSRYLNAFQRVQVLNPSLAKKLPNEGDTGLSPEEQKQAEEAIKQAGFSDYSEFLKVHGKIAPAIGLVQTKRLISKLDALAEKGSQSIDAQLQNPNLPEATRTQLQEKKAQFETGLKMAKTIAGTTTKAMELVTNKTTLEIVERRIDEIEKVTGMSSVPDELADFDLSTFDM